MTPALRSGLDTARKEISVIGAVLVATLGVFGFLRVADEVGEGDTRGFDRAIMLALRVNGDPGWPIGPRWLKQMAMDLTSLGSVTVLSLIVALVAGLFLFQKKRGEAAFAVLGAGGGLLMCGLLKDLFGRARPDLAFHLVEVTNASFPSGHAMLSAVVYLTLGALTARLMTGRGVRLYALTAAVALTALVGASRVYLGVHWPTDVLAGWCVGSAWAMACWLAAWAWTRWRGPKSEGEAY